MAHTYSSKERTSDVLNEDNVHVDFASLLLSCDVLSGLSQAGFERPSPIQLKAIPLGRCGLDLIIQAKSGTGKTCVFSVIILESLDLQCSGVQALVLTPTREIATQVQGVIQSIGTAMQGLRCHTFIGGTLFGPDRPKLKKCHVAVGTPGRVKQLIEYDVMHTDSIRLFVLDEADKLLEEKFQDQINWIYNRLPVNKQMLAVSATYPESLAKALTSYMRDPTFVRLNPRRVALKGIKQFYKVVPGHGLYHKAFEVKVQHLLQLLRQVSFSQCLVFSNLSSRAQNLSDILCERGWPSTCISGRQDQSQRHSAMSMLKTFKCRVLISTDLTARGIDAENVNLIINLDVPSDGKTYMHRIGRAGRFGSKGVAVTFASEGNEEAMLGKIRRQCHVGLQHLPDPVPSDLVNSASVRSNSPDSSEDLPGQLDYDDSARSNPDSDAETYTLEPREPCKSGIQESRVVAEDQSCITILDRPPKTIRSRSNHLLEVNGRGDAVPLALNPTVSEKACQVDTLSLPVKTHRPMDFRIPSLAERFGARREEEMWTWEKATKDFENFMTGRSESVVDPGDMREAGQGRTEEALMTSEEAVCSDGDDAAMSKFEDGPSTAPADENESCSAPEQTVHRNGNGEALDEPDQLGADRYPRPELEGAIAAENTTDNNSDLSCKEAAKETAHSDVNRIPERRTSPVASANEEHGGGGKREGHMSATDSNLTDQVERAPSLKANTEYKVAFSWRPSQNCVSGLLEDELTQLQMAKTGSDDAVESLDSPADTSAKGVRSSDTLNRTEDKARSSEGKKSKSQQVTHVEKRLSNATKGSTDSKQHSGATSSPEPQDYHRSGTGEPSPAPRRHRSSVKEATCGLPAPELRSSSTRRSQTREASRPGVDPIWESYTNFLKTKDDGPDGRDPSDDCGGNARTSDDQESSDDFTSDSVPGANQKSQELNPKPEIIAQHYGWAPSPCGPFAHNSWYGVPDFGSAYPYPNPTNPDYISQFGLTDYHTFPYNRQYTYWPYTYF